MANLFDDLIPAAPPGDDDALPVAGSRRARAPASDNLFADLMPASRPQVSMAAALQRPSMLQGLSEAAQPALKAHQSQPEEPGFFNTVGRAATRGLREGIIESGDTLTKPFTYDPNQEKAPDDDITRILQTPISKGYADPKWWATQIGYGAAKSSPSITLGVAGGMAGSPAGPVGTALGGAAGFGTGAAIQTLAPAYQRARSEGLDHDAAVDRAIKSTGIAGTFGAVMGAIPGMSVFGRTAEGALRKPISEALFQIFGAQPALGTGQHAATLKLEGKPITTDELGGAYALNVGTGMALTGAHAGVRALTPKGKGASATGDTAADSEKPAGSFSRGPLPNPGAAESGRPGLARAEETPSATNIFADLMPGAEPASPMLALTGQGDRLAYGGSGEALNKPFRRVDKTANEINAERLTRAVRAYEDELVASGKSPNDIADGINRTFGLEETAESIASGQVWWRLPERGRGIEPTGTLQSNVAQRPLSGAQRSEVLSLIEAGRSLSEVAQELKLNPLTVGAIVAAARPHVVEPARDPNALSPVQQLYTRSDLAGLTANEAAARLSEETGRPVTAKAIYQARGRAREKGIEPPAMAPSKLGAVSVWTDEVSAALHDAKSRRLTDEAAAAELNEKFGTDLTVNAVRKKLSKDRNNLTPGGRPREEPMRAVGGDDEGTPRRLSIDEAIRKGMSGDEPFANNNPLTGIDSLGRVARKETSLPSADELSAALRDVRGAEMQDLTRAFGGDASKARRWKSLWAQAENTSGERAKQLDAERAELARGAKGLDDEIVYADEHALADLAATYRDMERNPAEIPHILQRYLPDMPLSAKPSEKWSAREIAAMAVMRKAGFEIEASGLDPKVLTAEIRARYRERFSDPQDVAFMEDALRASIVPPRKDTPLLAIAGDDLAGQKAELLREWGRVLAPDNVDTGLRPVERTSSTEPASARPINWEAQAVRNLLEGRGRFPSARGDFPWPPEALHILRKAEGRQTFDQLATALTERFRHSVTRDMVAGKVRRLREISRDTIEPPMRAIGSDDEAPRGLISRLLRGSADDTGRDTEALPATVARQGAEPAGRRPREAAPARSAEGRELASGGRGGVRGFSLGGRAGRGLIVETANVGGLRQRRYFLFAGSGAEMPSGSHSPQVSLRVLKAARHWVAKAHLTETAPGEWQVLAVNVRKNRQRRGIGAALYDALGKDVGAQLGPSPSMTRNLAWFWKKRDPEAMRGYERIGDRYFSPEMLQALKRANDEILRAPPTPRDAAFAKRFGERLNELAGDKTPDSATRGDVEARQAIDAFLKMGRDVSVARDVVDAVNDAVRKNARVIPKGLRAGALSKVEPLRGEPEYLGADTVATVTTPDGETFQIQLPWSVLRGSRALYDNWTGSAIFTRFGSFGTAEQFSRTVTGEIHHEALHGLRRKGLLRGAAWDRLVSHAENLRLLDGELGSYLKMVGDPAASKVGPGTIRDAYERAYKNTTDLQERMAQEAVAHMVELYAHGELLPQEVAPVRDLLNALQRGEVPKAARGKAETGAKSDASPQLALGADGENRIVTPDGSMEVRAEPEIVDLADLRLASGAMQPRDRSRTESQTGMRERAANLDPSRLLPDRVSDSGAPIVTADGTVLSGNGRTMSIAEAYRDPALAERASRYRDAVLSYARQNGMGDDVLDMRHPVLVSRLSNDLSEAELRRFADLSNRSSVASMSATERAQRDASAAGPEVMGLYQGGRFTSPANREFFRTFVGKVVTANERGAISKNGELTAEGEARLGAAVLAAAYGDTETLGRMLESTDDNIRSISSAMRDAAGPFIRLKEDIRQGVASPKFDITAQIGETARRISEMRDRGVKLDQFLAQQDAFAKLDPVVEDLLLAFYQPGATRALSRDKLTTLLTAYAEEAARHQENGLIPDETKAADVIAYAYKRAQDGEAGLFADSASTAGGPNAGAGVAGQGPGAGAGRPAQGAAAYAAPGLAAKPRGGSSGGTAPPPVPPGGGLGGFPPRIPSSTPPAMPRAPIQIPSRLARLKTNILEYAQNSEERVRNLVDRVGQGRLPDNADPYLKAALYHGRLQSKVTRGYDEARDILRDVNGLASRNGESFESIRDVVNDYLIARHAPERNAVHGDGAAGLTDAQARYKLGQINARPDAADIRRIADKAQALNDQTLEMLHDADVISTSMFTKLRSIYKQHVPLNRVMQQDPDVGGGIAGRGFDVYSSGVKKAKGSDLEVSDILGNVVLNYEQAAMRSEKNLVDQSTLAFVRRHQADLAGLMRIRPPKIIGSRSDGSPIFEQTVDPRILHLFEDGKPVWIEIADPHLAAAFRGVGRQQLPQFMRMVAAFTRLYSGLQTRFNPEFAAPNKLRDLQEAMVYLAADKTIRGKGALKAVSRDPASIKDVLDYLRDRNTPGAQRYAEMVEAGGTTGGLGLSTRAQVELNIEKLEKLATSKPRQFAQSLVSLVDAWNTIFEDSTRLSIYRTARERGLSIERAAFLAKEGTVNFNRMGTAGPVVNALWMFSNASIQGSVKMLRSMKNPKVALGVGMVVGGAVAAVTEWNDDVDPKWRDKVSKWDRLNALPVVLPSEDGEGVRYVSIPVSWGIKPLYVLASHAYDEAKGKGAGMAQMINDFLVSVVEAYNPAGGTDLMQAITPTILDAPLDLSRNRSWSGSRIKPDFDADVPADKQYFMSLKDTTSGRAAIATSETLHDVAGIEVSPADLAYATEQYLGGAGRAVGKIANTLIGTATGDPPPADEFPLLSRFYRERSQEELGRGAAADMELIDQHREQQARAKFDVRDRADDALRKIEALPADDRPAEFLRLKKEDAAAAEIVGKALTKKALGQTYTDAAILKLGVENGERARYITEQLEDMSLDEATTFLKGLRAKKILTPTVASQVRRLRANKALRPKLPKVKTPPFTTRAPNSNPFMDLPVAKQGAANPFSDLVPRR